MKEIDIIQQIKSGEVSKVQFKERLLDNYDIGCELVAFSNARGGTLVVGVKDKTGSVNPLSYLKYRKPRIHLATSHQRMLFLPFLLMWKQFPWMVEALLWLILKKG